MPLLSTVSVPDATRDPNLASGRRGRRPKRVGVATSKVTHLLTFPLSHWHTQSLGLQTDSQTRHSREGGREGRQRDRR